MTLYPKLLNSCSMLSKISRPKAEDIFDKIKPTRFNLFSIAFSLYLSDTYVPRPGCLTIYPSLTSNSIAFLIVILLVKYCFVKTSSDGKQSSIL